MVHLVDDFDLLVAASRGLGKPVLYVSFDGDLPWEEVGKAAPYLLDEDGSFRWPQILADGRGYIACDSVEECARLFGLTVGDEGPTPSNPYDGPARVYAATSGGQENT